MTQNHQEGIGRCRKSGDPLLVKWRLLAAIFWVMLVPCLGIAEALENDLTSPSPAKLSSFVYPLMAPRVSSQFGLRVHPIRRFSKQHSGIDLAAPVGAQIRSIKKGTVVFADPYAGYGNFVVVQHDHGMSSHYGHCDKIIVKPGQRIAAGQVLATVGSTGMSTGPHLHFEIRISGKAYNPERFIPGIASPAEG